MYEHCLMIYKPLGDNRSSFFSYKGIAYRVLIDDVSDYDVVMEKLELIYDIIGHNNSHLISLDMISTHEKSIESISEEDYFFKDLDYCFDFDGFLQLIKEDNNSPTKLWAEASRLV